jgi:hypothetical protein
VLICGLIFGGKDKFMCGNNLGKRLILFSITFALGVLAVTFFVSNKLTEQKTPSAEIGQKTVSGEIKNTRVTEENCFPVNPDSEKLYENSALDKQLAALIEEKTKIRIWLQKNPGAAEKEKAKRRRSIDLIDKKILRLEEFFKVFEATDEMSQNLLYVEKCYEF